MTNYRNAFEKLKENILLSQIVSRFCKIITNGPMRYKACCPFHKEKTPSFFIDDKAGFYKCFGCNESGDLINFTTKIYNLSTKDALELLSNEFGVQIDDHEFTPKKDFDFIADIANQMHQIAKKTSTVMFYLQKKRKLTDDTIDFFKIGYCDDKLLTISNHSESEKIGFTNNGRYFFRNRLMIPIFEERNKILGFGGRILQDDKNTPKYINSKESGIFKKKEILFHFRDAISQKSDFILVVEGYMDVIKLHDVGIKNAVACLGTSITDEQIKKLINTKKKIVFGFDNDKSGYTASLRCLYKITKLMESTNIPYFIDYSDVTEKDFDEIVNKFDLKEDAKGVAHDLIQNSLPINEYLFNSLIDKYSNYSDPNIRVLIEKEFEDFCASIPNSALRKSYISWFRNRMYELTKGKSIHRKLNVDFTKRKEILEKEIIDLIYKNGCDVNTFSIFADKLEVHKVEILPDNEEFVNLLLQKYLYLTRINNKRSKRYELKNLIYKL